MLKKIMVIFLVTFLTACANTNSLVIYPDSPLSRGESNNDMGVRYLLGRGVVPNAEKAFYYFSKAADKGNAFAQNEVAYMYATGKGTEKNLAKAFYYYKQAAEQNLASAQYNLAIMYHNGLGTEKNPNAALKWFNKSAAHGFEPAKQALVAE
jgi:uncharacterized protein